MNPTNIKSEPVGRSPRKRTHRRIKIENTSSHPPFTFSSVFPSTSSQSTPNASTLPQRSTANASTFPQRLLTDFFSPTSSRSAQVLSKTEACSQPDSCPAPNSPIASLFISNDDLKVETPCLKTEVLSQTEESTSNCNLEDQNPVEELPTTSKTRNSSDAVSPISISNLECEEIEIIDLTYSPESCQETEINDQISPKTEILAEEIPQDPYPHASVSLQEEPSNVQEKESSNVLQQEEISNGPEKDQADKNSTNKNRMYKRRRSSRLTKNYTKDSNKVGTYYQYMVEVKKEYDEEEDDPFAEFKRKKRPRKDCPRCGRLNMALVWSGICQACNLKETFDRTKTLKSYERRKEAERVAQLESQKHEGSLESTVTSNVTNASTSST